MKKQTAVEWFHSELHKFTNGESKLTGLEILDQAISMEKEQIIDAYIDGYSAPENLGDSEQYYTSTFGS
jgi:hypothetical protein